MDTLANTGDVHCMMKDMKSTIISSLLYLLYLGVTEHGGQQSSVSYVNQFHKEILKRFLYFTLSLHIRLYGGWGAASSGRNASCKPLQDKITRVSEHGSIRAVAVYCESSCRLVPLLVAPTAQYFLKCSVPSYYISSDSSNTPRDCHLVQ